LKKRLAPRDPAVWRACVRNNFAFRVCQRGRSLQFPDVRRGNIPQKASLLKT
jgi:hypothetical protein